MWVCLRFIINTELKGDGNVERRTVWENLCRRKLKGNKVSLFVQLLDIVDVEDGKK